jgi:hypothetical protein
MTPELTIGLFTLGGALVGVFGTVIVSHIRREKLQITAYISELSPVLLVESDISRVISITYDGKTVNSIYEQKIAIINTGNKSIPVGNMIISFPGSKELLKSIFPQDMSVENFKLDYVENSPEARLSGDYLNSREKLELRFLISGEPETCDIKYREKDIKFIVRDRTIEKQDYEYLIDNLSSSTLMRIILKSILRAILSIK